MKAWLISSVVLAAAVVAVGCDGDDENPTGGSGGNTTTTTTDPAGSGGGGGGDTGTGGMGTGTGGGQSFPDTVCGNYCKHLAEVNTCPNESLTCVEECETLSGLAPWCSPHVEGYLSCIGQQPASSFQCDEDGELEPKNDVCVPEEEAFAGCWYEGEPDALPDMTADCQSYCDAAAGLACASANCLQECLDSMDYALPCNGAQAIVTHCFSQQPAASYECSPEQKPQPAGFECIIPVVLYASCMDPQPMP